MNQYIPFDFGYILNIVVKEDEEQLKVNSIKLSLISYSIPDEELENLESGEWFEKIANYSYYTEKNEEISNKFSKVYELAIDRTTNYVSGENDDALPYIIFGNSPILALISGTTENFIWLIDVPSSEFINYKQLNDGPNTNINSMLLYESERSVSYAYKFTVEQQNFEPSAIIEALNDKINSENCVSSFIGKDQEKRNLGIISSNIEYNFNNEVESEEIANKLYVNIQYIDSNKNVSTYGISGIYELSSNVPEGFGNVWVNENYAIYESNLNKNMWIFSETEKISLRSSSLASNFVAYINDKELPYDSLLSTSYSKDEWKLNSILNDKTIVHAYVNVIPEDIDYYYISSILTVDANANNVDGLTGNYSFTNEKTFEEELSMEYCDSIKWINNSNSTIKYMTDIDDGEGAWILIPNQILLDDLQDYFILKNIHSETELPFKQDSSSTSYPYYDEIQNDISTPYWTKVGNPLGNESFESFAVSIKTIILKQSYDEAAPEQEYYPTEFME